MDVGHYPNTATIAQVLASLRKRDGIPVETVLTEVRARQGGVQGATRKRMKSPAQPAILEEKFPHAHEPADPLPEPPHPDQPIPL